MSDFFVDLERRLVDATPQRARRIRRARQRRAAALTAVLLALVAGGAGLAAAVGGDDTASVGGPAATAPPTTTTAQTVPATPGTAPHRGSSTVAILNGTAVPGLARGVANRLQNLKFKIGNVTNASSQDHAQTAVFYARPADVPFATQVATAIDLGDTTLRPITEAQRIIAGAQARVVVVVGSDQNTTSMR